jgi:hypothetical protein
VNARRAGGTLAGEPRRAGRCDLRNAAALGKVAVQDPEGGSSTLAALWRRKPVVLVFIRHFG